jgi:hypothetical protein
MDPRVDASIDPFALVGADAVLGDRVALSLDEFLAGFRALPGAPRDERE